jgi:outer membrane protein insertion porin family
MRGRQPAKMLGMRSRMLRLVFVAFLQTAACGALFAAETYRLQTVRVIGSHRFKEEDLVAALGLKMGANVDIDALKQAGDRLMQTGALASLEYKYTPLSKGLAVEYTVTDGTDFLPCHYDNIVWMPPDELTKAVHDKVPLYSGEAPTSGELLDQIAQAISDVLNKIGVTTKVRYELHTKGMNGPVDSILFVSDSLRPKVQEISLTGATLMTAPEKEENTKRLIGEEYSASRVRESLTNGLFFLYGNKGYLRVEVGEPQAKLTGDPQQAQVAVTVPVTEGAQYRWKSIAWTGNAAIPLAELDKAVPVHVGEIVDHGKLDMEVASVQQNYKSKGYLAIHIQRLPTFHDVDHTVAYEMKVSEGDLYRMGALHLSGLDQSALDKLQKNWKLNRGEPYNEGYLKTFLKDNSALINGNGRSKTIKILQTPSPDKTVDVTLQF